MAQFVSLTKDALHVELGTDDTRVLFTGARRRHAINNGLRQFADLSECYIRQGTIQMPAGAQVFDLNSTSIIAAGDFLRVATDGPAFEISDSNGTYLTLAGDEFPQVSIPFLDHAQSGWRSTVTGLPTGWFLQSSGGALLFSLDRPLHLSTSSTQTAQVRLPYVAKPSSMTSDTDAPFTVAGLTRHDLQSYHQGLVHYAAHELEKLRKDREASDHQMQQFLGYVRRYQDATRPKGTRTVRTAVPYFTRARGGRG